MTQTVDLGGNTLIVENIKIGATASGQAGTDLSSTELTYLDGASTANSGTNKVLITGTSGALTIAGATGITGATSITGATAITSASASSLAVGLAGATTPAFVVDSSTASQAAGLKVTGAATGGTVAVVATDSGSDTNLTVNAKGSGTIGIGSVSTGAVTITPATTVTGAITPTGGIASAGGFTTRDAKCIRIGNGFPLVAGDGNDSTPVTTETYVSEVHIPNNVSVTGVALFNGSNVTGNVTVGLADSTGAPIAAAKSATTAGSGTDAFQLIPFAAPYAAKGPATYYVQVQYDSGTARYNTHAIGTHGVMKQTSQTYGVFASFTPPTTFVTAIGNMGSLY